MSEISPNDVNKVILGVSSGTILGLSISTHIGLGFGYQAVNIWIFFINLLALAVIKAFLPRMEGHEKDLNLQMQCIKTNKFIISVLFILFIGVAVSVVYNYFTIILLDLTNVHNEMICIFLFANGIASIVGTSLFGYLIHKRNNLAVLVYPIVFMTVIFLLGLEVKVSAYVFVLLIVFGMLDGSMHTISQYWISSSIKGAQEFANGVYLFTNNLNRSVGIFLGGLLIEWDMIYMIFVASITLFLMAFPFVMYRVRKYPIFDKKQTPVRNAPAAK
ncbi:MFS transporter [uncultured Methanobrevibacter sp.]|uniref:MFS transporter n=1 Tax=uncultured Methanobrevibacter sp. TaxID=253161 RepID=UPI0025FF7A15|nr:MFS transporter [uncultured Methanobrevibacter sp.]